MWYNKHMARTVTLQKTCEQCNSVFETLESRKRFCNRTCSATWNNLHKPKKEKQIQKTKIEKWLDGEWDGSVKYGLSTTVRRFLLEEADYKCSQCGWAGVNPVSGLSTLQIEHVDGNPSNNRRDNLKVLCPNCHSLTPTYGALNKGSGRAFRYGVVTQLVE